MSIISTVTEERPRRGIAGRVSAWLAAVGDSRRKARELASLEDFNDHLLRDIGHHREPAGSGRHLMRF